jgi:hypothetical protein
MLVFLVAVQTASSQSRYFRRNPRFEQVVPREHYRDVFRSIQDALSSGNTKLLSPLFADQVQMDLRGAEQGYFSAYQAGSLLGIYFRTRRLLNLVFTTISDSDSNPYATGGASFAERGVRDYVQVYVALSKSGDRWVISRFNIY